MEREVRIFNADEFPALQLLLPLSNSSHSRFQKTTVTAFIAGWLNAKS